MWADGEPGQRLYYDEDKRNHPSWCMIGTENSGLGGMRGRYLWYGRKKQLTGG